MKRQLLIILLLLLPLFGAAKVYSAAEIPNVQLADRTRYTSNPDGILSAEAVARIDSICASLRDNAIAQVAVVAVDDIDSDDVFSFAIDLFSKWGVGRAENNNGLGILLVKDRHEIRFVTGYGVEGVLPDAICKRIQQKYMLPAFRVDDYSTGMVAGVEAVAQLLRGSELDLGGTDVEDKFPVLAFLVILALVLVLPFVIFIIWFYAQKRCPKCHKYTLRKQSETQLKLTRSYKLVEKTYVCSHCGAVVKRQTKIPRNDNFSGGAGGGMLMGGMGGGHRSGGSMGGGSFGGGSFGGGGAGSKW